MKITSTDIPELLLIEPDVRGDDRGFFMETWHARTYAEKGLDANFVQDNQSRSQQGVLRGLHYQLKKPQGKLVRVVSGLVFDVAVDIRKGSPTFGSWVGTELSGDVHKQFYIPPGFAHGFCVLSESADFLYKCTEFHSPDDEYGILWNDPDIGIAWPGDQYLISEKDAGNARLRDLTELLPSFSDD